MSMDILRLVLAFKNQLILILTKSYNTFLPTRLLFVRMHKFNFQTKKKNPDIAAHLPETNRGMLARSSITTIYGLFTEGTSIEVKPMFLQGVMLGRALEYVLVLV